MSRQDKQDRIRNNARQRRYLAEGIVMLPTLREEREAKKPTRGRRKKGGKKK